MELRPAEWLKAYSQPVGRGSTFVRAAIVESEILKAAAPIPDVVPSPGQDQFLKDVVEAVGETLAVTAPV